VGIASYALETAPVEAIMTVNGPELLKAIRRIRAFFSDVSQLLLTTQTLMAQHGWKTVEGANCVYKLSGSVYLGRQWLPRVAARKMTNTTAFPGVVAMVSVLLDEVNESVKFTEPVVAGGYFLMSSEQEALGSWNASWFLWRGQAADGRPYTVADSDPDWKSSWGWGWHEGFARPLVAVTDQAKLEELVVNPLLAMIKAHMPSSSAAPQTPQPPTNLLSGEER
jgi:hypothetical protein